LEEVNKELQILYISLDGFQNSVNLYQVPVGFCMENNEIKNQLELEDKLSTLRIKIELWRLLYKTVSACVL